MKHYRRSHAAYNITTGELLVTPHGQSLKRFVAKTNKYNGIAGQWIFVHGRDWRDKLAAKMEHRY